MMKKYSYEIEFLAKELSPYGKKYYTASGAETLREMKSLFKQFLDRNGFKTSGAATKGSILNSKDQVIGKFSFGSIIVE